MCGVSVGFKVDDFGHTGIPQISSDDFKDSLSSMVTGMVTMAQEIWHGSRMDLR